MTLDEADHRAHREINASRDDDEGLPDRQNRRSSNPAEEGYEILLISPKAARAEGQHQPHDGQEGQQCQAEEPAHPDLFLVAASGPLRTPQGLVFAC